MSAETQEAWLGTPQSPGNPRSTEKEAERSEMQTSMMLFLLSIIN